MVQQVWLVTGCSTGFGEQFVKTILQRGDKAIATARKIDSIQHLADLGASTLQLDVTASQAELDEKIKQAIPFYGHINVVVHNAGYGELGALEDLTYLRNPPLEEIPTTLTAPPDKTPSSANTPSTSSA